MDRQATGGTGLLHEGQQWEVQGNQLHHPSGFVASTSDDVFRPYHLPDIPSADRGSPLSHTYRLPEVPVNPNPQYHAYSRRQTLMPTPQAPRAMYTNPSLPHIPTQPTVNQYPPFHQGYSQLPMPQPGPYRHPDYDTQHFPSPSHSPALTPTIVSKALPTVSHISILTSKLDFFAWDEGVTSLIRANGLIGHILDPSEPIDPNRPDRIPSLMPILSTIPSPHEIKNLNRWWDEDNITQHILVSRLGIIPRGLLPSPNLVTRTALSIYRMLVQYYGTCSFTDCTELLNSLHNSVCTTGRVQEYVSKWRTGISRLQSARFSFDVKTCISLFVRGLPLISAFTSLRADLPERIAAMPNQDLSSFVMITEKVLQLDTIFRSASQAQAPRPTHRPPPLSAPPPAPGPSSSTALPAVSDTTARAPKQIPTCGNCKSRGIRFSGHTDATCFQPGGGMEGRREEYMNNKSRVHAMFAEYLENAFSLQDSDTEIIPHSPPPDPLPVLDDELLIPPVANLSVPTFEQNTDLPFDLYDSCDSYIHSGQALALPVVDFKHSAFVSLLDSFNALLDSGCTHHIVRDRDLFQSYTARSISIGTANCGSLAALGTGDVKLRYPYGKRHVVFTLRGCLFAPAAPINLLSVGALVERGMSCLFSPGGITKVYFPQTHATLPGFVFDATVSNRLSFLQLEFIASPASASVSVATVPDVVSPGLSVSSESSLSFPRVRLDSMLWHRRFGHIGMEATRAALTKNYVTGVDLDGSFVREHCIACIVGKSPPAALCS